MVNYFSHRANAVFYILSVLIVSCVFSEIWRVFLYVHGKFEKSMILERPCEFESLTYRSWIFIRDYIPADLQQIDDPIQLLDSVRIYSFIILQSKTDWSNRSERYAMYPVKESLDRVQYWSLLNCQNLRLHCGCVAVPVN